MNRFWSKVDRSAACWEWTAARNADTGYGVFWDGRGMALAHRVAYQLTKGAIPEGLAIDHLCRNRGCVNPDHLEAVTPKENNRRAEVWLGGARFQSGKTQCPKGHDYSESNTYRNPNTGRRHCRTCRNEWQRDKRKVMPTIRRGEKPGVTVRVTEIT